MRRVSVKQLLGLGAAALLATACTTNPGGGGATPATPASTGGEVTGTVTFLLPNTTTTRFVEHDAPAFVAAMKQLAPGVTVNVQNAEGKSDLQLNQAQTAINAGTKAIVLAAADPSLSGAVLRLAADSRVPVIGYEHEALDGPLYTQVIFDPFKVGQAQGTYFAEHLPTAGDGKITIGRIYGNNGDNYTIKDLDGQNDKLKPLIDSGQVEVACEDYATGWDPAAAQRITEQCLTKTQNNLDAIIAMNDGTASGAIAALAGQNLAGRIPVYGGQDANLEALRFILQGRQASTVFKNYAVEGQTAAKVTVAAISGKAPPAEVINGTFDNHSVQAPAAYLDVQSIDASNMQTVVDAGLYTKQQLCEGISGVAFCGA
jgi:ABC-type xylose transport system substrate-binding protein